ncbi:MAG: hypothetical protein ACI4GV_08310 [Acutalibacteraceae bacterium]
MKKIKIDRFLCLFLAVVCLMLSAVSLTSFAARNEGNMEVTAHIEAPSAESSQPESSVADSSVAQDSGDVPTGDTMHHYVVIALLLLIISVPVILFCNKKDRNKHNI